MLKSEELSREKLGQVGSAPLVMSMCPARLSWIRSWRMGPREFRIRLNLDRDFEAFWSCPLVVNFHRAILDEFKQPLLHC